MDHFINHYEEIEQKFKDIIIEETSVSDNIPPVNVERIAHRVGIPVYLEKLDWDISGKITKDLEKEQGYYITINSSQPPNRQRFTLGHELAHYFLHREKIGDGITDDSLYRSAGISNLEDVEANRFSAKLLMPLELILHIKETNNDLQYIADKLRVSENALYIRLGIPYA